MRTGLFGGAFDPFHNGHLAICRAARTELRLDRLIVIPTWNAPHKNGFGAGYEDRYNMARLALADTDCEVSRYEGERGGVSYSAVTVEAFREKCPDDELFFIIGGDSYRDFHTWFCPERITAAATLAVYPRSGECVRVEPPAILLNVEKVDVSSTELRERLCRGLDVGGYVPRAVEEYILEHNLYKRGA